MTWIVGIGQRVVCWAIEQGEWLSDSGRRRGDAVGYLLTRQVAHDNFPWPQVLCLVTAANT